MPVYSTILFGNKQLQFLKFQKIALYKVVKYALIFSVVGLVAQLGERSVRIDMDAHRPTTAGPKFRREIPPKLTKTQNFKNPLFVLKNGQKAVIWAYSSAGRAYGSHP